MKSYNLKLFFLPLLLILLYKTIQAQQDTLSYKPAKLILIDGTELLGTILEEDSVNLEFKTVGEILLTIPKEKIKSKKFIRGEIIDKEFVREDPNSTRLFFAPTAKPLRSRKAYFSAYQIFFPMLAFGISDNFTLAGGMSLIPYSKTQLIYISPKFNLIEKDKLSIAIGLFNLSNTNSQFTLQGIYYSNLTYGTSKISITTGVGFTYSEKTITGNPIFLIGGELRLSNSIKLITENWLLTDINPSFVSFGVRFFGEHLSADLGLIKLSNGIDGIETGFPFIPWIGFTYNF